jgi:tetratricopeptide (TPR) repeat protein
MINKLAGLFALTTILLMGTVVAGANAEPMKSGDTSARLSYVERLLTESSAAKKVENSDNPKALELKAEANSHFDKARALYDGGDAEAAEAELGEAIRLLTAAARAANDDTTVSQKQTDDYGQRRESVEALATAHERIADEKGLDDMNDELQAKVGAQLSASDILLQDGKADEARALLDETYETIKTSLEQLRGGDTLVRELHFETKEDEYLYELDRNDTHQMLVQVLFAEKMESSPMRATAETFISKAVSLREDAESAAGKKKYEEAITLLEESTKELIRAIRSAGVYIPG